MSKYSIVIVEDEVLTLQRIIRHLNEYEQFEVVGKASDGLEAIAVIRSKQPDVIFLDIKIPKLNGFEVIKRLGQEDYKVLVFITAFDEYAIDAFENAAFDYLLKPFDHKRFSKLVDRLHQHLQLVIPKSKTILVKEGNTIVRVHLNQIDYIKSENNHITIYSEGRTYKKRTKISEVLVMLDASFARVHRCVVINTDKVSSMKHVKSGDYLITLSCGKRVISSKSYRSTVKLLLS